jgi:hypothetical protein
MDLPRERAFRGTAIDHQQNPRLTLTPLTEFAAPGVRSSEAHVNWVYRSMRRIGGHLDKSYYYEKLWNLSLFSKVNYRRCWTFSGPTQVLKGAQR